MKNEVEVEVFGQKHTVVGDSDPSHIKKISQYVDQAMARLASSMRTATATQLATLVAINVTDELFRLRKEYEDERDAIDIWARNTIQLIDQELRR